MTWQDKDHLDGYQLYMDIQFDKDQLDVDDQFDMDHLDMGHLTNADLKE